MAELVEVAVNRPCCYGCMACVEVAPEVFAFDESAQVAEVRANPCDAELARKAVAYCPDDCIDIID